MPDSEWARKTQEKHRFYRMGYDFYDYDFAPSFIIPPLDLPGRSKMGTTNPTSCDNRMGIMIEDDKRHTHH